MPIHLLPWLTLTEGAAQALRGTVVLGDRASLLRHFLPLQSSPYFLCPAENLPAVGGLDENIYLPQTAMQLPLPELGGQVD